VELIVGYAGAEKGKGKSGLNYLDQFLFGFQTD
jgi:hypothetical protein